MCLQCLTKSKVIVKEILPGYCLQKATVGHAEWPKGYYGLVRINDPDFIWKGEPLEDPLYNMPDSEVDALPNKSLLLKKNREYFDRVEQIEKHLVTSMGERLDIMAMYALVKACKKIGYKEKVHGYRVVAWLSHHMALKIKKTDQKKIKIAPGLKISSGIKKGKL